MPTLLKIATLVAVILAFTITVLVHQSEKKRLNLEIASLREQLSASAAVQDENKKLAEQLKIARETLLTERSELLRSRAQAQSLRQLEQENARLKTTMQRSANVTPPTPPPVEPTQTNAPATPVSPTTIDLGAVELDLGAPNRFDLGEGQQLVITPALLDDGNVQLDLALTANNAAGKENVLASARVTAHEGQRVSISVGDRMISLQPTFKLELEDE